MRTRSTRWACATRSASPSTRVRALTIGDVGGSDFEEIDYVADPEPGLNFGWNDFEGMEATTFGIDPAADPHTPPIHAYANDSATCAVTGGYVVRDPDLAALFGQYLYADFCQGSLQALQVPSGDPGTFPSQGSRTPAPSARAPAGSSTSPRSEATSSPSSQ